MSFLSARKKELKKASTYPKSFPIWKDLTVQAGRPAFTGFSEVDLTIKDQIYFFLIARKAFTLTGERWVISINVDFDGRFYKQNDHS